MEENEASSSSSVVFRQLRAAPSNAEEHAAQLQLARSILDRRSIQLPLPRKAQARALLEWAVGRCMPPQEGKGKTSSPSAIQDPAFWNLFADILAAKQDEDPHATSSAIQIPTPNTSVPTLLSKSDIRQIVLLSRGPALFASLKACLDDACDYAASADTSRSSGFSNASSNTTIAQLFIDLSAVFRTLLPLSLSSPASTLDGILPCIHAFIRTSASIAARADLLASWNELGQLLAGALESIVAATTSADKLVIKKISASFLEKGNGDYANWKNFMHAQSQILTELAQVSTPVVLPSSSRVRSASTGTGLGTAIQGKGKGKARQSDLATMSPSMRLVASMGLHLPATAGAQSNTTSRTKPLQTVLSILDDMLRTAIFSRPNLRRAFSNSSHSVSTIESPQQAQEALADLFSAMRSSTTPRASTTVNAAKASSNSSSQLEVLVLLPRIFSLFQHSVSVHANDLFSHSGLAAGRGARLAGTSMGPAAATQASAQGNSRSATEYLVQTAFRHAIFGFIRSTLDLLQGLARSSADTQTSDGKKSPSKRPREGEEDTANSSLAAGKSGWAIAQALKLIFRQLHEKNAYSAGGSDASRAWLAILRDAARFCTTTLLTTPSRSSSTQQEETSVLAASSTMKGLATIARLDFAAVDGEDVLPATYKAIAGATSYSSANAAAKVSQQSTSSLVQACDAFVDVALAFHGKTRQLPQFIAHVKQAMQQECEDRAAQLGSTGDLSAIVDAVFRSPLVSVSARTRLAKECRASLGTTQFPALVRELLEDLKISSAEVSSASTTKSAAGPEDETSEQPRKKSKKGRHFPATDFSSTPTESVHVQLASWKSLLITQILQALLTSTSASQAFDSGAGPGNGPSSQAQIELADMVFNFVESYKIDTPAVAASTDSHQRVITCALQLQVAWTAFTREDGLLPFDVDAQLQVLQATKACLPSLQYEIVASMLSQIQSTGNSLLVEHRSRLFNYAIAMIVHVPDDMTNTWNGYSHCLTPKALPIALWWLIGLRYLDVLEQDATDDDLARVANIILGNGVHETRERSEITLPAINNRLMHSAEFFEQLRLRTRMNLRIADLAANGRLGTSELEILLLFPEEYLDRPLKRTVTAAVAASAGTIFDRATLLVLAKCTHDDPGTPLVKTHEFLVRLAKSANHVDDQLVKTLFAQLWTLTLQNWVATPARFESLPDVLEQLRQSQPTVESINPPVIYLNSWRILVEEVRASVIPLDVRTKLEPMIEQLQQTGVAQPSHTQEQVSSVLQALGPYNVARLVTSWYAGPVRRVEENEQHLGDLAKKTLSTLLVPEDRPDAYAIYVQDALQLATSAVAQGQMDFSTFAVSHWLIAQKYDLKGPVCRNILAQASKGQPMESYRSATSMMLDAVSPDLQSDALACALSTLATMICNPPETATKVAAQAFTNSIRRISLLRDGSAISAMPSCVLVSATSFVRTFLEQKIGLLELLDASNILLILQDLLSAPASPLSAPEDAGAVAERPSDDHASKLLLDIVAILSVLATHRRDLIIPLFSDFSTVLGSLLRLLRLSGRSGKLVTSQFPSWAVTARGTWQTSQLHGKAVSRLLLGLGTRTSVLQRSSTRDNSGTFKNATIISLTGVLSKHAPFLMVKYLSAVTDSRIAMSSAMRNELQPGILEVLGSLGKPEREAVMKAFLGAEQEAERTMLRTMWRDLDAVRYKGD